MIGKESDPQFCLYIEIKKISFNTYKNYLEVIKIVKILVRDSALM